MEPKELFKSVFRQTPYNEDTKVLINYRRLKDIKRCNNFPVNNVEDVAQHSFYVTIFSMALAMEYNDWAADINMKYHPYDCDNRKELVNVDAVIRKALAHDLEEAFTSDIPWNVKHASEDVHKAISEAVDDKMREVYAGCKTMRVFREANSECKRGFEGQFVEIADMLELGMYAYEEVNKGNAGMYPMLKKCTDLVKSYELFETLMEASPIFKSLVTLMESYDDNIWWFANLMNID